ncbi:Forkhead-associated (FHA) domain profile [Nakaseomyces glabratus]|nr:hypothetical protein LTX96_0003204 [Nakaseomyces glabratus]
MPSVIGIIRFQIDKGGKKQKVALVGRSSKSRLVKFNGNNIPKICIDDPLISSRHALISAKLQTRKTNITQLDIIIKTISHSAILVDTIRHRIVPKLVIRDGERFGLIPGPASNNQIEPKYMVQIHIILVDNEYGIYELQLFDVSSGIFSPIQLGIAAIKGLEHHYDSSPSAYLYQKQTARLANKKMTKHVQKRIIKLRHQKNRNLLNKQMKHMFVGTLVGTILGSCGVLGLIAYFGDEIESFL